MNYWITHQKGGNYPVWHTDPIPSAQQTWGCKKNIEKQIDGLMTMIWSTPIFFETSSYFPAIETNRNWAYSGIDPNPHSKLGHRKPLQCRIIPQLLPFLHAENDVQNMSKPAQFGGNKHLLVGKLFFFLNL